MSAENMTAAPSRLEISEAAVLARIRRGLAKDDKRMEVNRRVAALRRSGYTTGDALACLFLVIDSHTNSIADGFDDAEDYARDLGVLKPHEFVSEPEA